MTTAAVHPRDGRPAPPWAVRAAHLIPLATLPSGLWRIALVAGVPLGVPDSAKAVGPWAWWALYVVSLSLVTEALALLSVGLVRPWGEIFPRWLPLIGGRRVPPTVAVAAAGAGGVAVTLIFGYATVNMLAGRAELAISGAGWALLTVCYAPLLLWGPLLLAVTVAYYRRRCRD
ncbi:hypothetical protein ACFY3U_25025 [Micromonospora sp. NPDC000089]|uniref:hypothetical protein n=1 Tax=unclassified Micromonospora TaxID=2617518 RepID=UPI0036CDD373